ncbi:hypothetical protein P8H26_14085 [Pseudochrobactrum sp. sp1633]|uniref:hypothetical protein n=1 Tax=Pseudochrobactrum sp. sp1633 TaxID=3036706 RepID=UPI0025A55731|nr:hypothetical protein [Pseudochrobactrum sp. sp1633]MDM8346523.1 hypothetical protein [Pseudochrobactrum sp. sp1633]HWD12740.1 hypothetical protein [Pseudochrobactrum sp.]
MERDHKFSGTLPLLAYAPQDFGLNAQRSRAYRARAAMGRTGVQPLRSHAQAPSMLEKTQIVALEPEQTSSLFKKIWLRLTGILKARRNADVAAETSLHLPVASEKAPRSVAADVERNVARVLNRKAHEEQFVTERPLQATLDEALPKPAAEENAVEDSRQPVSKTYAAMRKNAAAAVAEDQSIPQAPDLAHALAEIRQALREHEKLANARQNENSTR